MDADLAYLLITAVASVASAVAGHYRGRRSVAPPPVDAYAPTQLAPADRTGPQRALPPADAVHVDPTLAASLREFLQHNSGNVLATQRDVSRVEDKCVVAINMARGNERRLDVHQDQLDALRRANANGAAE